MPVIDALAKHATLTPDKIAISIAGNEITYKTLYQRAEALRGNLFNLEKRHPDRFGLPDDGRLVLLALPNHFRFGEIFAGGSASPHCVAVLSVATPVVRQVHIALLFFLLLRHQTRLKKLCVGLIPTLSFAKTKAASLQKLPERLIYQRFMLKKMPTLHQRMSVFWKELFPIGR